MAETDGKGTVPYTKGATITKLFELIEHKKAPPTVDGDWAKSLDLEPKRPSSVPNLFRWLGVTNQNDEPDKERWDSIRHADTRSEALTGLVKDAYSDLFEATEAEKEPREQLRREFARVYNLGDATERVTCFLKLCEIAGLEMAASGSARTSSSSGTKGEPSAEVRKSTARATKKAVATKPAQGQSRTPPAPPSDGLAFVVNLNVDIPAEWSQEQIVERVRAIQQAVADT